MELKLKVRCLDRTVFEVNRDTLEAKSCGSYDPYCYSDPEKDVEYMEHSEWCLKKQARYFSELS
jgi:hypothetical protein